MSCFFIAEHLFLKKSHQLFIEGIKELAENNTDIEIIFRAHPATFVEQLEYEKEFFKRTPNITITNDKNLSEFIVSSECVITWQSTSAIDAWALNKPVLSFLPLKGFEENDTWQTNYTSIAKDIKELEMYLSSILSKTLVEDSDIVNKRNEYIKTWYYKLDYKATDSLSKIVDALCESKYIKYNKIEENILRKDKICIWKKDVFGYIKRRLKMFLKANKNSYINKKDINDATNIISNMFESKK